MTYGFTGTKKGMTPAQKIVVRMLFRELNMTVLHHGDCVGADKEADAIALESAEKIIVHPPLDPTHRAWCGMEGLLVFRHDVVQARPYLTRNRHIVREGKDGLIATPKDFVMPKSLRGQGTWTTIEYAKELKRKVWIVTPDGKWREE